MADPFCIRCDRKVPFEVCYREMQVTRINRQDPSAAKSITYMEAYAICKRCGEELYVPDVNDRNAALCNFHWTISDLAQKIKEEQKDGE